MVHSPIFSLLLLLISFTFYTIEGNVISIQFDDQGDSLHQELDRSPDQPLVPQKRVELNTLESTFSPLSVNDRETIEKQLRSRIDKYLEKMMRQMLLLSRPRYGRSIKSKSPNFAITVEWKTVKCVAQVNLKVRGKWWNVLQYFFTKLLDRRVNYQ